MVRRLALARALSLGATVAQEYGGLMIWELGGDVSTANATSLLLLISKAH